MAKLVKFTPLSGGSTMVMQMSFDSKQSMDKYLEKEEAKKKTVKQAVQQVLNDLVENNGKQRTMPIAKAVQEFKWKNPGEEEVEASCNTLCKGWQQIDLSTKYVILDDGKGVPTGVIPKELLTECAQSAKLELESNPILGRMFNGSRTTQLVELLSPIHWLHHEMQTLHIRKEVRDKVCFKLGRVAATGISIKDMWSAVLRHHHGFLKTLWEVQTFGSCQQEDNEEEEQERLEMQHTPKTSRSSKRERKPARHNPDASDSD